MRSLDFLAALLLSLVMMSSAAWADGYPPAVPYAPQLTDAVHVDLTSRLQTFNIPDVAIGAGGLGLVHSISSTDGSFALWKIADTYISRVVYPNSGNLSAPTGGPANSAENSTGTISNTDAQPVLSVSPANGNAFSVSYGTANGTVTFQVTGHPTESQDHQRSVRDRRCIGLSANLAQQRHRNAIEQ